MAIRNLLAIKSQTAPQNEFRVVDTDGNISINLGSDLVDTNVREDLADTTDVDKGAALVGYKHPVPGAVARDLYGKAQEIVSLLDFIPESEHAAIRAGTSTYDAVSALITAIGTGKRIIAPAGTYKFNSALSSAVASVSLQGEGEDTVFDCSGGGTLLLDAGLSALPNLASDIVRGTSTVSFASAHGLSRGDVFCVWNPTNNSWSDHRENYRDGDWMRVAEVVNTTDIKIYGTAPDTYTAVSVECHKMLGGRVAISDIYFVPPTTGIPLKISRHQGVVVRDVTCADGAADTAISIDQCYDFSVQGGGSTVHSGNAYPLIIANSKKGTITGSGQYSNRHVVALGGGASTGSVPTRDLIISNALLTNLDTGIGAADAHGNCDNVSYVNCTMDVVANLAGRNTSAIGCRIVGRNSFADGNCIFGSEIVGGVYRIHNCHLVTGGDGTSFGIIHFVPTKLAEDWLLDINGVTVENHNAANSSTMRVITVAVANDPINVYQIDVRIRGLNVKADNCFAVMNFAGTIDISAHSSLAIDDLDAPGCSLVVASNSVNFNIPMRLPEQQVTHLFNIRLADAVNSYISGVLSYKWAYPSTLRPHVVTGWDNNAAGTWTISDGDIPIVYPYDNRHNLARFRIVTADASNFGSDQDIRCVIRARIDTL